MHYITRTCVSVLSHFSHVRLFAILWTITCQVSLSMGFSRQEYWSGLPFPSPWGLPKPGIEPVSHISCIDRFFTTRTTWEVPQIVIICVSIVSILYLFFLLLIHAFFFVILFLLLTLDQICFSFLSSLLLKNLMVDHWFYIFFLI